jgi:hypothetical protein
MTDSFSDAQSCYMIVFFPSSLKSWRFASFLGLIRAGPFLKNMPKVE